MVKQEKEIIMNKYPNKKLKKCITWKKNVIKLLNLKKAKLEMITKT